MIWHVASPSAQNRKPPNIIYSNSWNTTYGIWNTTHWGHWDRAPVNSENNNITMKIDTPFHHPFNKGFSLTKTIQLLGSPHDELETPIWLYVMEKSYYSYIIHPFLDRTFPNKNQLFWGPAMTRETPMTRWKFTLRGTPKLWWSVQEEPRDAVLLAPHVFLHTLHPGLSGEKSHGGHCWIDACRCVYVIENI